MRRGRSFYLTLCFALFLRVAALTSPVVADAEDNLPVAGDGSIVFLPWRCGAYVALPESEQIRRGLEAAADFGGNGLHFGGNGLHFGGSGLRLRGGTVFFSAIRRRPGSLQIIIGRGRGGDGDDVNDISANGGGPGMSPLVMAASRGRGSGEGIPTSDTDSSSSRTLRAEGEEKQQQQVTQPAAAAATATAEAKLFPWLQAEQEQEEEEGGAGDGDKSSDSSSSSVDDLLSILFPAPHALPRQSPFLGDRKKLLLARTLGIRAMEVGTPSWLSRSGRQEKDEDDGSVSEREVMTTAAAAAAEAARGVFSNKAWELSAPGDRDLLPVAIAEEEDGDTTSSSRSGRDDASSPLWEGGFVGNDLHILSSKVFRFPGVYSWSARDADRGEEGGGEEEGMVFRDVLLLPRRGEEQEEGEEEVVEGAGEVGILRCVKGWWSELSRWAVGVGRSMRETVLQYRSTVEDGAFFALATAVPMTLLLLIVHVAARCTYNDEEEEEGGEGEEEEDDDDDDEEGGKQQGSRTVVVVTANAVGNDGVRTPLLDNRLYRGEEPSSDADEDMMNKLEATVVDYNPPNPADMTRGV
ncbi:hypothetical protein CBR_g54093 [Chara braunii]|uniref:Uncharacterized protein n=1 Tax=Chara braunii TaxID=69332 RepID=A0A388MBQ5_CHABU|nr:hypothetical protein CBR_g54093 [Chara braunii]|eukprot:GBG91998.1 hypothetical protein CBR_g54093 [Chara braunii]